MTTNGFDADGTSRTENEGEFERGATRFSATLAATVAVAAALALGVAAGDALGVVATLAGAVAVALGVRALTIETNDRRAAGSVGVVLGTVAFAAAALFGRYLAFVVGLAATAAIVNAVVDFDDDLAWPVARATWRSATVLGVASVLAVCLHADVFVGTARVTADGLVAVATAHDLARLIALQVEVLAVAELLYWAVPVLDRWLPADRDVRASILGYVDFRLEDVPRTYWAFLGGQLLFALTGGGPRWFAGLLASMSAFGDAVALLLRSGVLHLPLAAVAGFLLVVLVGRAIQLTFVSWAGTNPPRSLAFAAGGLVTVAATALLAASPLGDAFVAAAAETVWKEEIALFGVVGTLLGSVALTLLAAAALREFGFAFVEPFVTTDTAGGFALSAGLLLAGSIAAAELGAAPLAVFAGVAGALVVHDLGSNASELGTQVGRFAETRTGEVAHAVGGLLVAGVGVALAAASAYVLGPITTSVPAWRARLALALVLLAVLSFVALIRET
ncbi:MULTISPECIES: DUF7519 family protein [Halorussus]|uniref:DUF7519 family protein n=1 Tax=Halorussus TaxID=1070314 RepID=UPI0020A15CF1|nr:hypothetical protein [Halorussus vallis]USZ77915.1 hypothetical protein NGM07_22305 [Halorussus vallis]